MGLFKKIKSAIKDAAPAIGGVVGFAIGGGPLGAAIGSGIGSLAGGRSVEDALKNAALGGLAGGVAKFAGFGKGIGGGYEQYLPSYTSKGVTTGALGFGPTSQNVVSTVGGGMPEGTASMIGSKSGLGSLFDSDLLKYGALGLGAAGLMAGLTPEEEAEAARRGEGPPGEAFGTVVGRSGTVYNVDDPTDMEQYRSELAELQQPGYSYYDDPYRSVKRGSGYLTAADGGEVHAGGGEVSGPGTGTSDSVPARLSDGEFVLTAKAVRGAGGGDRDMGAARLYDMMSELEATA